MGGGVVSPTLWRRRECHCGVEVVLPLWYRVEVISSLSGNSLIILWRESLFPLYKLFTVFFFSILPFMRLHFSKEALRNLVLMLTCGAWVQPFITVQQVYLLSCHMGDERITQICNLTLFSIFSGKS